MRHHRLLNSHANGATRAPHVVSWAVLLMATSSLAGCGGSAGSAVGPVAHMQSQVSVPKISPNSTTISGSTPVYITDAIPGATIIYTLDGTNPSPTNGATCPASATVGCFTLLGAATIKAVAEDASGSVSAVAAQDYAAPTASNACVGWNPKTLYASSDFTADQATITSAGATLGVDCNGGGYVDYLNTGYGSFGNQIAVAYGRGYQVSIRDSLHSSFYNPTQAGIDDGDGTPVTLALTTSPQGAGGRINIVPFTMPLFLNSGFCFFPLSYYFPSDTNGLPDCTSGAVTDGIFTQELDANIPAAQQIASNFSFSGYYEDAADLGDNVASIFAYHFTLAYVGNPGAPGNPGATSWVAPQVESNYNSIYKFGSAATFVSGGTSASVLDTAYEASQYDIPAYADVSDPGALISVQPTPTDLVIAQIAAGLRLQLTGGYTDYMTLNASCDGWNLPQSLNLAASAVTYVGTIYPMPSSPCGSVVALSNPNEENAPTIALYFPQTDPVNARQVVETDVLTGKTVSLDRRVSTKMLAESYIVPNVPYRQDYGIQFVNQFTEIVPVMRISGLLAPNHAGANIDESVAGEMFVLIGSPANVFTALQNMNRNEGWDW